MLWEIIALVLVAGFAIFIIYAYGKFFKNARPVDAQNMNAIYFGKTTDYHYPPEDNQIRLTGLELKEDEMPKHHLEGWQKVHDKKIPDDGSGFRNQ